MTDSSPAAQPDTESCIILRIDRAAPPEVIRIDAQGFHYRGQLIEDAGEAHRLFVEFLRNHQPEPRATQENADG